MAGAVPRWFKETLAKLIDGRDLDPGGMGELMRGLLDGGCGEAETAALLIALAAKGETPGELAAAAAVMRSLGSSLEVARDDLLDTCGTGGDGIGTFNISTATALVAAGAGVPVVKHGNRAVSSQSGSADVLSALGVAVSTDARRARVCLRRTGMAFCLAPQFHPALRHVSEVRRRLGVPTLFNRLGPLANPAGAAFQLIGLGRSAWLDPMAEALALLGTRRALLVCSRDGLDEVSLSSVTLVREVVGKEVRAHEWTPDDFGLAPCRLDDLRVDGPEASASVIRAVLAGEDGPPLRTVLANTAAALLVAGRASTLRAGVDCARKAITSGRAAHVLAGLVEHSNAGAG